MEKLKDNKKSTKPKFLYGGVVYYNPDLSTFCVAHAAGPPDVSGDRNATPIFLKL